jgi:hypothetical protein
MQNLILLIIAITAGLAGTAYFCIQYFKNGNFEYIALMEGFVVLSAAVFIQRKRKKLKKYDETSC